MKRLDEFTHERKFDFCKFDVQGAELLVLQGGERTIENGCELILLEVAIIEYNQGIPLWNDVQKFMDDIGFATWDIFDIHYIGEQCAHLDILFAKKKSEFW